MHINTIYFLYNIVLNNQTQLSIFCRLQFLQALFEGYATCMILQLSRIAIHSSIDLVVKTWWSLPKGWTQRWTPARFLIFLL